MNQPIIWVVFGLIIALAIALVYVTVKKKDIMEPDYRSFFWMGIAFVIFYLAGLIAGRGEGLAAFMVLGVIYAVMGLAHKSRWGQPRRRLTEAQRRRKIWGVSVLAGVLVLGVVVLFFSS